MAERQSVFLDTNFLVYLLSTDARKADRAEALLDQGGCIVSVQVLNELVNVARRKLQLPWERIAQLTGLISKLCRVEPLTLESHDRARALAERYGLDFYDSLIVAAALGARCTVLYSEDMQDGFRIERTLQIRNPFVDS